MRGFDRGSLLARIEEIKFLVRERKEQLAKLKMLLKKPDNKGVESSLLQKTRYALHQVQEEIRNLEAERLSIAGFLKTPGEGAVIVRKRIFPKVRLVVQSYAMEVGEEAMGGTYIAREDTVQSI